MAKTIDSFMDDKGRVIDWPGRRRRAEQKMVLDYLITKFEIGVEYTEKQVTEILNKYHTFSDWALLRREFFERGYMGRTKDGAKYWRIM